MIMGPLSRILLNIKQQKHVDLWLKIAERQTLSDQEFCVMRPSWLLSGRYLSSVSSCKDEPSLNCSVAHHTRCLFGSCPETDSVSHQTNGSTSIQCHPVFPGCSGWCYPKATQSLITILLKEHCSIDILSRDIATRNHCHVFLGTFFALFVCLFVCLFIFSFSWVSCVN